MMLGDSTRIIMNRTGSAIKRSSSPSKLSDSPLSLDGVGLKFWLGFLGMAGPFFCCKIAKAQITKIDCENILGL